MGDMSDPAQYRALLRATRQAEEETFDLDEPDGSGATSTAVSRPAARTTPGPDALAGIDVQVVPVDGRGDIGAGDVLARFADRVDELGGSVAAIAARWRESLQERLPDDPRERWRMSTVSMEFGVNLEASSGIVICHGKTAATFKVAITWTARDTGTP